MKKVLAYIVAFSTMISGVILGQKGCNMVKDTIKKSSLSQNIDDLIDKIKDKFKNKEIDIIEDLINQM